MELTLVNGALKPCPFCGGEAAYGTVMYSDAVRHADGRRQRELHFINCIVCGVDARGLQGQFSKREAADFWNRRHVPEGVR